MIADEIELTQLAADVRGGGDVEHAIKLFSQVIDTWNGILQKDPSNTTAKLWLAISHGGLGECYADLNDFEKAQALMKLERESLESLFDKTRDFHVLTELVVCLQNHAIMALNRDDINASKQQLNELDTWITQMQLLDSGKTALQSKALQHRIRADIARAEDKHNEVISHLQQAVELMNQVKKARSGGYELNLWFELVCYLARTHAVLKQYHEGLGVIERAVELIDANADLRIFRNMTKTSQLEVMLEYHHLLLHTGASHKLLAEVATRTQRLLQLNSDVNNSWMDALRIRFEETIGSF